MYLNVVATPIFKNNGFKEGFIDKIEIKPVGLDETPEVEVLSIDKSPLKWREKKGIRCEFRIIIDLSYLAKFSSDVAPKGWFDFPFKAFFYDNAGKLIYWEILMPKLSFYKDNK